MTPCLIDTGCNTSIIPAKFVSEPTPTANRTVMTVNGSVPVLGTWTQPLSLGLTTDDHLELPPFKFNVIDVDFDHIFLGTDFLIENNFSINLAKGFLEQPDTGLRLPLYKAHHGRDVFWSHFLEADFKSGVIETSNIPNSPSDQPSANESRCVQLLNSFPNIVQPPHYHGKPRHNYVLDIQLTSKLQYPRMRPRACSIAHQQIIDDNFNDLKTRGAVSNGTSEYASPVTIVSKKDGTPRICVDYTRLNQHTADLQNAIPCIRSLPLRLNRNHQWFSTIDLKEAYYSLPLSNKASRLATIVTQNGSYIPSRTMFGLKNAPSKFCELIADLIQGLETFVFAYLDDFIVFSESFTEHLSHLKRLFSRINEFGLFVNVKKCVFAKQEVTFLGHTFSVEGMKPLQDKVQAIRQMKQPTTIKEVRRFLGCVNYYRPFLPNLAEATAPLTELLSVKRGTPKSTKICWENRQQQSFQKCINLLANATALNYENHSLPLILCTDASLTHAGAVLEQVADSPEGSITKPLAFFSKKFPKSVSVRSTFNRELTAVYFATRYFRHRIVGRHCILKTDHKALLGAISNPTGVHSPNEERMLQFIKEFNLITKHVDGKENQVADCLSRPPGFEAILPPKKSSEINQPSPVCLAADTSPQATTASSAINGPQFKHISLELAHQEQQKEPNLYGDTLRSLNSTRTKPKPTLSKVFTTSNMPVYAITTVNDTHPRIVLPQSLRVVAFHEAHNILHQGHERSFDSLAFQYYWPNMKSDIELWVKACPQCQQNKISRHNRQQLHNFPANPARLRVLHVDLVCPSAISYLSFGNDTVGFRFILTMRDRATGFVVAVPIKDKRTTTIIWTLFLHYFSIFGPPDTLVADNGLEFASAAFHAFCKEQGTKINHTTAYHPQSNGAIERIHRDLKTMIRNLPCKTDWAQHIPLFTMAYNNQACDINSYTSFQHLFGQPGRLPGHIINPDNKFDVGRILSLHTEAFSELMSWHYRKARPLPDNKPHIDEKLSTCSKVWVLNSAPKGNLAPLYTGPYDVLIKQAKYFVIKIDNVIKSVSIDRLKPFFALPSITHSSRYNLRASENRASLKKVYSDFV